MAEAFDPIPVLAALQRHRVEFIVVGGIAAIAQGSPLPTYDIDVTPRRDVPNIARLVAALRELEATLRTPRERVPFPLEPNMLAAADAWTLATNRGPLDLMFCPAGTTGYDDLRRSAFDVDLGTGEPLLVASLADVVRMKEATGREKDRAQLPALRRALELISEADAEAD